MKVAFDFETVKLLPDGSKVASPDFWHPDFRVDSCAFTWREGDKLQSLFIQGEDAVGEQLKKHAAAGDEMICHNMQFEYGVTYCRYPGLELNWHADTMRLSQNYDNGGGKDDFDWDLENEFSLVPGDKPKLKRVPLEGLGLVKCVRRILSDPEDHKKEAHDWIFTNVPGVKTQKQAGNHLDKLPLDILERYNVADTEATLRLYEYITAAFARDGYDWKLDHSLYIPAAQRIAMSQKRGIRVERTKLTSFRDDTIKEIAEIEASFLRDFAKEIGQLELDRAVNWILAPKTTNGQRKRFLAWTEGKPAALKAIKFNSGSNKQLSELFVGHLGMVPKFFTKKGAPSFKSAHLFQWGSGGQTLLNRRKRLIVQKQADAILIQSAYDGRLHVQLRACGTRTGRFAGTGGVNIQALSRREKRLMESLLPEDGYVFVSTDAASGEPTVITEFTKDPMYKYFCFDGIGKAPYYEGGQLMISDIYLGYLSVCPVKSFNHEMWDIFHNERFGDNKTFSEQWLIDDEVVKNHPRIKKIRKHGKWMALGFGYGLGPKNVVVKAIEAGLDADSRDGKQAFQSYWNLFKGIKRYADYLEKVTKVDGWFTNPFGYRCVPEEPRKAFNLRVQSSVSGMFNWFSILMDHAMPEALYTCTIHDENIYMIPKGSEDIYLDALRKVTNEINNELKWCVNMRFGAVFGNNLFEAK